MLKTFNKARICCPVVFFEEIWGGKYPAGPRASCLKTYLIEITFSKNFDQVPFDNSHQDSSLKI